MCEGEDAIDIQLGKVRFIGKENSAKFYEIPSTNGDRLSKKHPQSVPGSVSVSVLVSVGEKKENVDKIKYKKLLEGERGKRQRKIKIKRESFHVPLYSIHFYSFSLHQQFLLSSSTTLIYFYTRFLYSESNRNAVF